MGEGATIQVMLLEEFAIGFHFGVFGSVWSFNLSLMFIAICIDFKRRTEKGTKFIEFIKR